MALEETAPGRGDEGWSFQRKAAILAIGTAISQGFVVLTSPVLTRIYSPEEFGLLQVYLSVLSFGVAAATLRYEMAILQPEKDEDAVCLVILSLGISLMMSVVAGGILYAITSMRAWGRIEGLVPVIWVLSLSTGSAGIAQALGYWFLRRGRYARLSGSRVAQSAGQVGIQTSVGLFHWSSVGLVLGDALGRTIGAAVLLWSFLRGERKLVSMVTVAKLRKVMFDYRRFPTIAASSALINTAGFSVPMLLVDRFYGSQVLGWLCLTDRVIGLPLMLVSQAVSQVYMNQAAELARRNPKELRTLYLRLVSRLALIGFLPCLVFFIIAPWLFSRVFGQSWEEAGNYARLLTGMHYLSFVSWPLIPTLTILERQGLQLFWDLGRFVMTSAMFVIGASLHWSARNVVLAYGAAMFLGYAMHLVLCYSAIRTRVERPIGTVG